MKYIKYQLCNVQPLRIANDLTSQSGQTDTLKYIPGSSVRGYIINALAKQEDFENIKSELFGENVSFLNAYIKDGSHTLIPSPKGFYESKKQDLKLQNVVANGFADGKRAAIGEYCYFDGNTVHYYSVETGSDLKIVLADERKKKEQNVFRLEYIQPGYLFEGYIRVEDIELANRVFDVIGDVVYLGNAKNQGLGRCKVLSKELCDEMPYSIFTSQNAIKQTAYLCFVSHGTMTDEFGNPCGLNLKELEDQLGVCNLKIEICATSSIRVRGYNRNWGIKTPEIPMYEQGSVFRLSFDGTISEENAVKFMNTGVGLRTNEGYGRILLLKDYDKLIQKQPHAVTKAEYGEAGAQPGDEAQLKMLARNYYRLLLKRAKESKLRRGDDLISGPKAAKVRNLIDENRYNPEEAKKVLNKYFFHEQEKEDRQSIQKIRASVGLVWSKVNKILNESYAEAVEYAGPETIMGYRCDQLLPAEEEERLKMDYIIECMQMENRKGKA